MSRPFRYEWDGTVRRLKLAPNVKLIAAYTSQYADNEGRNARPGVERLALETGLAEITVKRCLKLLRSLGLLKLVRSGSAQGRRGQANEYELAIPEDILDKVPLVTAVDISPMHPARNRDPQGIRDTEPEQVSPEDPCSEDSAEEQVSPSDTCSAGTGIPGGQEQVSPRDPPPTRDHASSYTTPDSEDLRTAVTGPRARGSDDSRDIDELDTQPGARPEPEPPPLPDRCAHGMHARRRRDGSSSCVFCRRAANPGHAPPDNVIPFPDRRTA